ncbi:MAG: hypothetical protein PHO33_02815, partial [Clostridia bacterium]|nr:hypothetical protein [Clostridia bacterium]
SVGSYWLKFFEEIAHHLSLTLLGGNFCPHNGITEENLKKYYEKNGFNVYVDENNDKKIIKKINEETICKIKENSLNYRDFIIYESIVKFGKQQDLAQEI